MQGHPYHDAALFDRIVSSIYVAASGKLAWEEVLEGIAAPLGAWLVALAAIDKRAQRVLFSHIGGPANPAANLEYVRKYFKLDLRTGLLLSNPAGTWIHCHEHLDEAHVARDPFFQEFLIPYGGRYATGIKLIDDDEMAVVMSAQRGIGNAPLAADDVAWFGRICRHMIEALGIYRQQRALHLEFSAVRTVLDRFTHPILLIDEQRAIRYSNRAAQAWLECAGHMSARDGILRCRDRNIDAALTQALRAAYATQDGSGRHSRYMRLDSAGSAGPAGGLCLSTVDPTDFMGVFGTEPLLMLVPHDPQRGPQIDPFIIAAAFDLTPAESRVAFELAHRATAKSIAAERGVSVLTVRTQIAAILSKTGLQRQADLVRAVLTLPSDLL